MAMTYNISDFFKVLEFLFYIRTDKLRLYWMTFLGKLYRRDEVKERHRHRYEVNPRHVPELSRRGLLFVGKSLSLLFFKFL